MTTYESFPEFSSFLDGVPGRSCVRTCRQILSLLCTGQLLPQGSDVPGVPSRLFEAGWLAVQAGCFGVSAWAELRRGFVQRRAGAESPLQPADYVLGQAINQIHAWCESAGLQTGLPAVNLPADAEELARGLAAVAWQPDAELGQTHQQLFGTEAFYKELQTQIVSLLRASARGQRASVRELMESDGFNDIWIPAVTVLQQPADYQKVVENYRGRIATGRVNDFRAFYKKHVQYTVREFTGRVLGVQEAPVVLLSEPDQASGRGPEAAVRLASGDFLQQLQQLSLNARQQSVVVLRIWEMEFFAECREVAWPLVVAVSEAGCELRLQEVLRARELSSNRPQSDAEKREAFHALSWELQRANAGKRHFFGRLQQQPLSPSGRLEQQRDCLVALRRAVTERSLAKAIEPWKLQLEDYKLSARGERVPGTAESKLRDDFVKFVVKCYQENQARRRLLKQQLELQGLRDPAALRDPEIAYIMSCAVGTVEAAQVQLRQVLEGRGRAGGVSPLAAFGVRDRTEELKKRLEESQLYAALRCDLDLPHEDS
jgi:hypothetical protein